MWAVKPRISLKITSQRKPLPSQALPWHSGVFCVCLARAGGWSTHPVYVRQVGARGQWPLGTVDSLEPWTLPLALFIMEQSSVPGAPTPK